MGVERLSVNIGALGKCGDGDLVVGRFGEQVGEGLAYGASGTNNAPISLFSLDRSHKNNPQSLPMCIL